MTNKLVPKGIPATLPRPSASSRTGGSVTNLAPRNPTDYSTPASSVFLVIHVHWVSDAISPSAAPFSFCLQSFPASGSFPMSLLFPPGGQGIGASASVLPMNIQGWPPLGLTHLIPLQSKALSRVFSNTTVQKHQFFDAQLSLGGSGKIFLLFILILSI